jgi:hypothetical protein
MDFVRILIAGVLAGFAAAMGGLLGHLLQGLVQRPGTPADGSPPSKRMARLGAVSFGGLAAALTGPLHLDVAVERMLLPRTPVEERMDRMGATLADDPLFREQVAGKSPAEANAFGHALAAQGVLRLPGQELRRIAAIRDHLASLSEPVCLQLWTGQQNLDEKGMLAVVGRLPPAEQDEFVRLTSQALRLQLHGEGTPPPARDPARAVRALATSLGERGDEFLRIAGEGLNAPASDACAGVHMALRAVPELSDEDARSVMALFL